MAWPYIWWTGLGKDIKEIVKNFKPLALHQRFHQLCHSINWNSKTMHLWIRLYVDFAGPFLNKMCLLAVGALSGLKYVKFQSDIHQLVDYLMSQRALSSLRCSQTSGDKKRPAMCFFKINRIYYTHFLYPVIRRAIDKSNGLCNHLGRPFEKE